MDKLKIACVGVFLTGMVALLYGRATPSKTLYQSLSRECAPYYESEQKNVPSACVEPTMPQVYNVDYIYGPYIPFIRKHNADILSAAQTYHVPPELIAGIIVSENNGCSLFGRSLLDDLKDDTGLLWNNILGSKLNAPLDLSLGVGQINLSTAAFLNTQYNKPKRSYSELEDTLQDPDKNIEYIAMNLSWLTHRSNRQLPSGKTSFDPHYLSVIGTEYVIGPTSTSLEHAVPRLEGTSYAGFIGRIPSNALFGESATITVSEQNSLRTFSDVAKRIYKKNKNPVVDVTSN